jgi:hypothetical protein
MSWAIFKTEMVLKAANPNWNSIEDYADFFTKKYDECMRRGIDILTGNTVMNANTELMKSILIIALMNGLNSKSESFYNQSLSLFGKAIVGYWTGAELTKVIPIIPAPGTILNLGVVSNTVINPGVWPAIPIPILPSTSPAPFIDSFILAASIHLQSISGICNTISQYPPLAPPGPGVIIWQGFVVT